jgi:hypothetical protein
MDWERIKADCYSMADHQLRLEKRSTLCSETMSESPLILPHVVLKQ